MRILENIQEAVPELPGWYCARTKPKHESLAAANLQKHLGLEVFYPRLRIERITRRGVMSVIEPLFPGYIFVRCHLGARLNDIRYTNGISTVVHFADLIPQIADAVIEDLRQHFADGEPMVMEDPLVPGVEVLLAEGAFEGMRVPVMRVMQGKQRVQVLMEILGQSTLVELDRRAVKMEKGAQWMAAPLLAASPC